MPCDGGVATVATRPVPKSLVSTDEETSGVPAAVVPLSAKAFGAIDSVTVADDVCPEESVTV